MQMSQDTARTYSETNKNYWTTGERGKIMAILQQSYGDPVYGDTDLAVFPATGIAVRGVPEDLLMIQEGADKPEIKSPEDASVWTTRPVPRIFYDVMRLPVKK